MWSTVWFSFTFFELYAYFMIYSFLGWAMESTYVSINAKKWVNRGFINGPFCPIYGTGALLILLALKPVSDSILLLFLGWLCDCNRCGISHRADIGKAFPCHMVGLFPKAL